MNCPRCTNPMIMINPRAHVCHGCNIAVCDAPARSAEQELADALQREWDR